MKKQTRILEAKFSKLSSIIAFLFIVSIFLWQIIPRMNYLSMAQTEPSFTFTAAGDYSSNVNRTTAVLNGMNPANSGAQFNIALGDLSYGNKTPETVWCDYVKSKVGADFPFELIPGNHESNGPAGNNIDNFELCLPHRATAAVTGRYSREYYFDYPTEAPLARFIGISPQMIFNDEGQYSYLSGNAHYNWVVSAIDDARNAGIKWIVVGMHVNCITMGVKPCGMGADLFNLLINKKVDLILQGHDHTYQRSKQLALGPLCTGIVPGSYNANCVVDDGSDNLYTKGAGTIVAIVGNGGIGNYDINTADTEAPYFVKWYGVKLNPMVGYLFATVSASEMNLSFKRMYGPDFTDDYRIVDSSIPTDTPTPSPTIDPNAPTPTITPTPSDTPTPTVTPIASPTPMTMILNPIEDTFVNSSSPNTKYGSNILLKVNGNLTKISYLKFNLSSLSGIVIQSAKLRFRVSATSKVLQSVNYVADNTWSESAMTYNNRPAIGNQISTFPGGTMGIWVEVPVTSAVSTYAGQIMSISVNSSFVDDFTFYSKDNVTDKPELVVFYQ